MAATKLTKRVVDGLEPKSSRYVVWDTSIKGFGVRVSPNGRKAYVLFYRAADGTQRKPTIGTHGDITLFQAREIAHDFLGKVRAGGDPSQERQNARVAPTVEDLCKLYLKEHAIPHKKPSSVAKDRQNIKNHIIPRLGTRKVASISFADVERLHREMHRTPMAANRVLSLLSKMFNLAERWGLRKGTNPTKHVRRYRERKVHRHLSEIEVARFAKILREAESSADPTMAVNPRAVAIIRLLMFTGCRRGEILNLKWSEVDLDRNLIRLEDSKTGPKIVPLNSAAREVIAAQARTTGNPYVFPGTKPGRPLHDIKGPWDHIRQRAGLEGVRLHDLRHNFASFAAAGGLSLHMIGRLLGHRTPLTTARYADLADDPAQRASEKVGGVLSTLLSGGERA